MSPSVLLTRNAFRTAVFIRDGSRCVFCQRTAQETPEGKLDAHHIVDRRLWADGGYYLDNGATVCEDHHRLCEQTRISVEEVRACAQIRTVHLPDHLEGDQVYDKWGNPILPNQTRLRGELFFDAGVQKILEAGGVLGLFTHHVKYPRTWHLPFSPGATASDRVLPDLSDFEGEDVVVTVKMDGECTTLYRDKIHARSLDYASRIDRHLCKALQARVGPDLPPEWRVCGENLWAEHSIRYENLPATLLVFSIWNETNTCLSWDETVEWAGMLDLPLVPVLYRGPFDLHLLKHLYTPTHQGDPCEGFVVRWARSFPYSAFRRAVGKYVRSDHNQTEHWTIRPNGLQLRG